MTIRAPHHTSTRCRSCGGSDLVDILDLGITPIADRLVAPDFAGQEYTAPLTLSHCTACALCQIRETVEPAILFGPDYPYYSSVSPSLMRHFAKSAQAIVQDRGLGPGDLVVEAASNDGYMLCHFRDAGCRTLGIDPADGPVRVAREKGIETRHAFFGESLARDLVAEGHSARVFLANNVLAHTAQINDFVAGIATILAPDGVAILELPYLVDLVDTGAFDTIYHQHLMYMSVTALMPIFARQGLHLNDVERLSIHGGSLRLFVSRETARSARLAALVAQETARGVTSPDFYAPLAERIAILRRETRAMLENLRAQGRRIAGYGAAAKATTLLAHFGIGAELLDFIVDKSAWKQGLSMPVTRIPILPPSALATRRPDAVLLLAWNFADEIIAENADYLQRGGQFIVPVPALRVVTRADIPEGVS